MESLYPKGHKEKYFALRFHCPGSQWLVEVRPFVPLRSQLSQTWRVILEKCRHYKSCFFGVNSEKNIKSPFSFILTPVTRDSLNVWTIFQAYHFFVNSWDKMGYIFKICRKIASKWAIEDQNWNTGEGVMAGGRYMSKVWPTISLLPVIQFWLAIAHYFANQ